MFGTYLRRELVNRRKQTIIIATGMALAIALVIIVNSVAAGVQGAQSSVLASVYGVGTDITISQAAVAPSAGSAPGQKFAFGAADGTTTGGTTAVSTSRLTAGRGTTTFAETTLATVTGQSGVTAAAGVLALNNTTFNGAVPGAASGSAGSTGSTGTTRTAPAAGTAPTGGPDGAGGSSFNVDSFTVLGLNPAADAVGPLTAVSLTAGRTLAAADTGKDVAVLDAAYATSASLALNSTIGIGGTDFTIVGLVSSASGDAATASNVYIPLDVAQTLSTETGMISSIYVQAASASDIPALKTTLQAALPANTVSTQADLASSVSGSLATASSLVANLGTWLSAIVLAAAFLIAILFTISGVTRRTREFGTLKAIGWGNRRIVGQVAGESLVQGLIGGVLGIAIGLIGVLVVNIIAPTLTGAATSASTGRGGPGGFGGAAKAVATTTIALNAPVTVSVILIAVALAVVGGLLAGAIGGWRASRLRPAEALRAVA